MKSKFFLAGLILLLFAKGNTGFSQDLTTVEQVLRASLKAKGGEEAWGKITTWKEKHSIRASKTDVKDNTLRSVGLDANVTHYYRYPAYCYTESVHVSVANSRQVAVGVPGNYKMIWYLGENKTPVQIENPGPYYPCTELKILNKLLDKAGPLSAETLNDKLCYVFTVTEAKSTTTYYYDKASYLLYATIFKGEKTNSTTFYMEYREVEGVLVSFLRKSVRKMSQADFETETKVESLEINGEIKELFFEEEYKKLES